jgi:two-component system nitrate/nitrite sensor histidine kinase NarX
LLVVDFWRHLFAINHDVIYFIYGLTFFVLGLAVAMQKLAADPRFRSLVAVNLDLNLPESFSLTPERSIHVLAILQEALSNIIRHAHARHASVAAAFQDGRLLLVVKDDGIGLPEYVEGEHGLRNMRDRASLLHGTLAVERLARGTSVSLDIPLDENP